jgi:hypothetical protein
VRYPARFILACSADSSCGSDGLIQTQVGVGTAVRKDRTRVAAIIVMPQCKTNSRWTEPAKEELAQQHPEMEKIAFADDPKSYADVADKIGKTPVWISMAVMIRLRRSMVRANSTKPSKPRAAMSADFLNITVLKCSAVFYDRYFRQEISSGPARDSKPPANQRMSLAA